MVGPHRDDLKIKINGEDVRTYGSQGQQRTAALSIKLAEAEVFGARFGEYPVLLLDDALSELDEGRRGRIVDKIAGLQTVITCTEADELVEKRASKRFTVSGGKIENVR